MGRIRSLISRLILRLAKRQELVWGTTPLINNKYWSEALKLAGWRSVTLMTHHYPSFRRDDFDMYFEDLIPAWMTTKRYRHTIGILCALWYIFRNASVFHLSFGGGPLGTTRFWKLEAFLLRLAGIRTVLIPYGGDIWMYSRIPDASVRHGLLAHYPAAARNEREIAQRVEYWTRHADVIIASGVIGSTMLGRWDVLTFNCLCIDLESWKARGPSSEADGKRGKVRIIHTPNHRLYKGTEYIINAVEYLREHEGLSVELILLEGAANEAVRQSMQEADILVDQLINAGHGLSAVEGMASGLPVLANLEDHSALAAFRRYGVLDECPIISTSPETVIRNLRALILNPRLRSELGHCSRQYAEKYHSAEMAQYLFGSIYQKILDNKPVFLPSLFHPLLSNYMKDRPMIRHPLTQNQLPKKYTQADVDVST